MTNPRPHSAIAHNKTWSIQEFADLFGVTPRAIRFYEDKGLLSPSRESGARIFAIKDHRRLDRIMRAKRLGFTLDDIKAVLDVTDGVVAERAELSQRRDNFKRVIESLKRRRTDIDILAQELTDLCSLIDDHLSRTPEDTLVSDLASAYQKALARHLSPDSYDNDNL